MKDFNSNIQKILNIIKYSRRVISKYDYGNFFNLARFIFYIIAVFYPVSKKEIENMIKEWDKEKEVSSYLFDTGIEILKKRGIVFEDCSKDAYEVSLTDSGYQYLFEELSSELNIGQVVSELRLKVLNIRKKLVK